MSAGTDWVKRDADEEPQRRQSRQTARTEQQSPVRASVAHEDTTGRRLTSPQPRRLAADAEPSRRKGSYPPRGVLSPVRWPGSKAAAPAVAAAPSAVSSRKQEEPLSPRRRAPAGNRSVRSPEPRSKLARSRPEAEPGRHEDMEDRHWVHRAEVGSGQGLLDKGIDDQGRSRSPATRQPRQHSPQRPRQGKERSPQRQRHTSPETPKRHSTKRDLEQQQSSAQKRRSVTQQSSAQQKRLPSPRERVDGRLGTKLSTRDRREPDSGRHARRLSPERPECDRTAQRLRQASPVRQARVSADDRPRSSKSATGVRPSRGGCDGSPQSPRRREDELRGSGSATALTPRRSNEWPDRSPRSPQRRDEEPGIGRATTASKLPSIGKRRDQNPRAERRRDASPVRNAARNASQSRRRPEPGSSDARRDQHETGCDGTRSDQYDDDAPRSEPHSDQRPSDGGAHDERGEASLLPPPPPPLPPIPAPQPTLKSRLAPPPPYVSGGL